MGMLMDEEKEENLIQGDDSERREPNRRTARDAQDGMADAEEYCENRDLLPTET